MDISEITAFSVIDVSGIFPGVHLKYSFVLWMFIPIFFILLFIIRKSFVKLSEKDPAKDATRSKKGLQLLMLCTRSIIYLSLLIAIASPFIETQTTVQGDPFVQIIVDNSSSFELFDQAEIDRLTSNLRTEIKVETSVMREKDSSPLGDTILNKLNTNQHVLLITDGYNNKGADLGDVALYASRLNTTISAVKFNPVKDDSRILIRGPSKTLQEVENTFVVEVQKSDPEKSVRVTVLVDGAVVIDETTKENELVFSKSFSDGYHRITATLDTDDYFKENNVFYKTVKVVPKPKILFYSEKESPLFDLLSQVYEVEKVTGVDPTINEYHALVVNDVPANSLDTHHELISDYVADGNGLLVIGGVNSFDKGAYKDSLIESILPVFVGAPGKQEGEMNVVLVLDISGSTGAITGDGGKAVDLEKAQAMSVLDDMKVDNRLAVVAFNTEGYVIEPLTHMYEKSGLVDKIGSLRDNGGTLIDQGILKAVDLLRNVEGSKNIILISDGITQIVARTMNAAQLASDLGINIYTVGVGPKANKPLMQKVAELGNGIYFDADHSSRLRLLFGDLLEGEGDEWGVTILNDNHFITDSLSVNGTILGYNTVTPKTTARLLMTTSSADPLLAVWRFGLGRIASYTTDDGSVYGGQMLAKGNSALFTRSINWVVGDPDRKQETFVEVSDTTLNRETQILIKNERVPSADGINFYKVGDDLYQATIFPQEVGFSSLLGAVFAVNYNNEFEQVGFNKELNSITSSTGGKVFASSDVSGIVEHAITVAKKSIITEEFIRWPFILLAIGLFLIEIFMRKLSQYRAMSE